MTHSGQVRGRLSRRPSLRIVAWALVGAAILGALAYLVFGVGVDALLEHILGLPSWLILLLVFLLPALEASAFVGVVFPGEIAVLLGGVAAGRGSVNFAAVLTAACLGAVLGDQAGYGIGRRYGQQVLRRLPDRILDEERLEHARAFVRRTGAKGVVLGRWTAALRALVPGLAGLSHMPYARFATANIAGGVLWACAVASVGYVAGDNWHRVQSALGSASSALLGLVVLAALAWHVNRRLRERRRHAAAARAGPEASTAPAVEAAAAAPSPVLTGASLPGASPPAAPVAAIAHKGVEAGEGGLGPDSSVSADTP